MYFSGKKNKFASHDHNGGFDVVIGIVALGLALMIGGPRLGGQLIGGTVKAIVQAFVTVLQIALLIPWHILKVFSLILGGGLRWLTKPRQREPRY